MITQEELRKIILKDLKIDFLKPEIQDEILAKLGENIIKRISLVVLEALPEEARAEFDNISQSGDQEKMQQFLKAQIPDFEKLIYETIKKTIEEYKMLAGIK